MIFESASSELKKKHLDRKFFSCVVAPNNINKYYAAIIVFYKILIEQEATTYNNHFKDCIVYGRRQNNSCELLGNIDEIYQSSSTYFTFLKDDKLWMLNAVSNNRSDIGTYSNISDEMKQIFRIMAPDIFRKNFLLDKMVSISENYNIIKKSGGFLVIESDSKYGFYSLKHEREEIYPVFDRISMWNKDSIVCSIDNFSVTFSLDSLSKYSKKIIFKRIFD